MRASSQASMDAARERFAPVLVQAGAKASDLGEELFAVSDLVASQTSVLRALSDPSREGSDKATLAERILSGQVSSDVLDLVCGMVRSRWTSSEDLTFAFGELGVDAVLASAQAEDKLSDIESELFSVQRTLAQNRALRLALADKSRSVADRKQLLDTVFSGKVTANTTILLHRALAQVHTTTFAASLVRLIEACAEHRNQLLATVTAARPLTQAQVERLRSIVERAYGRKAHVNVAVDPSVLGGLLMRVGDEVVDATVLARLDEARRRLAG